MPESQRITVTLAELATNIRIWLVVFGQRRPAVLRDLWTRRGEEYDRAKIEHARTELANHLAGRILYGSHELTREAMGNEGRGEEYHPGGKAGQ